MESRKLTILVPTDFTEIADYAVDHAVKISKLLKKEITLLHVVKKDSDIPEAEKMIQAQVDAISKKYQIKPHTLIREGSIFTTIGEVSNELHAEMVVMGTHGRKGVQKITGSWALKVIVKSKAPCIVVQEPIKSHLIEKIVFPIDFKRENIEKVGWALLLAKRFNAKIYIYKATSKVRFLGFIRFNDKTFFRNIFSNTKTTEKYFRNNEIDYEVIQAEPEINFVDQTIEFSQKIGADLIIITTTKSINISDYILGASEQSLIDNHAKIPVMCVNPRPRKVGSFSSTGAG